MKLSPDMNPEKNTKILVITPHYEPDFGPSAPIFTWLCEDLSQIHYQVGVVTNVPHYGNAKKLYPYPAGKITSETLNGVNVYRTPVLDVPRQAKWRRILYHMGVNLNAAVTTLKLKKPDIILADGPTLWSGLPVLLKAIIPGTPYIYIVFDIFPDVLERLGFISSSWFVQMIGSVEKYYYQKSQKVVVLSEGFKENLIKKGIPSEKIRVIPTSVDTDAFCPRERENYMRKAWNLSGKFIALYAGNIGFSQNLETIIETAELLSNKKDVHFVIVGEGATAQEIKDLVLKKELENVSLFPFQPFKDVPYVYSAADICLVSMKHGLVVESVPSKTYTIMACGRPVVATVDADTEVGMLIKNSHCGSCVEAGNSRALADEILYLKDHPEIRGQMEQNARRYAVDHYSRSIVSQKYHQVISECLEGKNDSSL